MLGVLLLATWAPLALGTAADAWDSSLPRLVADLCWVLGFLAFLATAWRIEYAVRVRATGAGWALACALVTSLAVSRLRGGLGPSSLDEYVALARARPTTLLFGYGAIVTITGVVAIQCVTLRRRLAGAPEVSDAPRLPLPIRTACLHASALEARLMLAVGLAAFQSAYYVLWSDVAQMWAGFLAFGDVLLDALALWAMTRLSVRAPGTRLLAAGVLLRVSVMLVPYAWARLVFMVAAVLPLAGHYRFLGWCMGSLEPYCLGKTRDAYRAATVPILAAMLVITAAVGFLRTGSFVVVAGATAVVGVLLLRRHVQAALDVVQEGEAAKPRGQASA
jgi:hypothetical protein